ncbi:MAG TPA: biopolymer transporter ExbD [Xanthomonadales bacterium]|nr:biopolymer transporter ExbD [Xanthomonadales bacterium]
MRYREKKDSIQAIDIAPLIDIVFILLIFFMVSTTFERQAVLKVDLPEATAVETPTEIPDKLELVIDPMGRMYLNDQQLVDDQRLTMVAAFQQAAGERRDIPLVLRADRMTPHHYVVMAMDVAADLGFHNLSIATDRSADSVNSGEPRE